MRSRPNSTVRAWCSRLSPAGVKRDAPAVAVEQCSVHGSLQVGQAVADGRGRQKFALGRPANAAQLAHRHKQLQRCQVDTARKTASKLFMGR